MVMLHILQQLSVELPFELRVLHLNHAQRGAVSDKDAEFVQAYCEQQNIPFYLERLTNLAPGASEDVLRQARYAWFDSILDSYSPAKIATAHHLDDQLETVLMRMAKGATLKGLRGIPVKRPGFIRPFLGLTRAEIDAYATKQSIPFREDASNADTAFLRNRIRRELLPIFRSVFGSSFYKGFEKSLRELDGAWETLIKIQQQRFDTICQNSADQTTVLLSDYRRLNAFERRALLEYCISTPNNLTSSVSEKFWLSFERFVHSARVGARFEVTEHLVVFKNRDALRFVSASPLAEYPVQLFPGQTVQWKQFRLTLQAEEQDRVRLDSNPFQEYFCADRVHFPLTVREWRKGDRFKPLGMQGFKKVSDFLVDSKTELQEKLNVPVVCSDHTIVWLAGMRLDERFKLNDTCKQIYKIVMEKGV